MSHHRLVWKETTVGAAASVVATAISFLMVPFTTRALGLDAWGTLATALAWGALFATVFHLSLNQVAIHHLSRPSAPTSAAVFGAVLAIVLVSSAVAITVGIGLWLVTDGSLFRGVPLRVLAGALAAVPFTVWTIVSQGLFQAQGRVMTYSFLSVLAAAVSAASILLAVGRLDRGIEGVLAAYVLAGAVFAAVSFTTLRRRAGRPSLDAVTVHALLRASSVLHWAAIGYFVFSASDVLIISMHRDAGEVAWYRLASLLLGAALLVPSAMTSSFFALGGRLGAEAAWPIHRRLIIQAMLGSVALVALAYPLVPWGIRVLAGPDFAPAATLLRILLLALPGLMASALFAPQWILRGMLWQATSLTIGTGFLNLLLNLWAVPRWGAEGAAWVRVACSVVALGVNLAAARLLFEPRRPKESET